MQPKFSSSLLLPFFASAVIAADIQCRGSCRVETPALADQIPGTIRIDGPSHAVADLSPAAGWEVLDCPSDWKSGSVDVRLVCTTKNPEADCHHVLEQGAVHTVVRLPLDCGVGPFARIASWDVAKDQSIPPGSKADRKLRRRGLSPDVVAATLDYNFRAIPLDRGPISFDVTAAHDNDVKDRIQETAHVPLAVRAVEFDHPSKVAASADFGLPGISIPSIPIPTLPSIDLPDLPSVTLPSIPTSVDLPDLPSISLPHIPTSIDLPDLPTIPTTIHLPTLPSIHIPLPTTLPIPSLPDLSKGVEKSKGFEAINMKKNVTIIDESMGCNFGKIGFDQSASISADTDILVNAAYAFKIAGTLTPPDVTDFALAGAMSGKIHSTFNIDMYLSANILFPPMKIIGLGIPGFFIPGIITLGPEVSLSLQLDLDVDVAFAATMPMTYDFQRLDFVFPSSLAPSSGEGQASQSTHSFGLNVSPGDQTGSIGLHVIPKIEFGIDLLNGLAEAGVYVGIDADATFASNGTIYPDFTYDGCQDFSIGAVAKAGVSAGALKFFHIGDFIPLYQKRDTLWQHCSKRDDGPAGAIEDNGDGTFTNALGDLVNENGQLIDDQGNVIPDGDAADLAPPPVTDENGQPIPEDQLILDNGDGTFEDAWGNATNSAGQRISFNGTIMGCELDTSQPLLDADGKAIPPEEAIFDAGQGTYSNTQCQLVNDAGQLIDDDGNVIDYEPITDETGAVIPMDQVVIDNEDGTYNDPYGNPVDQWGGAIDTDDDGNVIPVTLEPAEDDEEQEPADPDSLPDPPFDIISPDALETAVLNLIHGQAPPALPSVSAPGSSSTAAPAPPSTSAPAPPSTSAPAPPSTSVPAPPSTEAPAPPTTNVPPPPSTETPAPSSTEASRPPGPVPPVSETEQPTLVPNPNPSPAPSQCSASKKAKRVTNAPAAARRSDSVKKETSQPQPLTFRRRSPHEKREGSFGCTLPSLSGLPLPPITGIDQLFPFF